MAALGLSPDQLAKLKSMALEGFTIKEIAAEVPCTYTVAQRHGTKARKDAGLGPLVRANCADATQKKLKELLRTGMTSYQAAVVLNRSSAALRRYASEIYEELRQEGITCPCGDYIGHRGGCDYRVRLQSMPRETSWYWKTAHLRGPRERIRVEHKARQKDALFDRIWGLVSFGIAPDIRDDIIQDVYLDTLTGGLETASLTSLVKRAKSRAMDQWADTFRTKSLDMTSGDDFNLYKVLAACDGREVESIWDHNPWFIEERIEEFWA